jgi:hypothetical protein
MARWNVHGAEWKARNPLQTDALVKEVMAGKLSLDTPVSPVGDACWYTLDRVPELVIAIRHAQGLPPPTPGEMPIPLPIDPNAPRGKKRTLRAVATAGTPAPSRTTSKPSLNDIDSILGEIPKSEINPYADEAPRKPSAPAPAMAKPAEAPTADAPAPAPEAEGALTRWWRKIRGA